MANHEINTTINIATNVTGPSGGGGSGVGGASRQLAHLVSAARALQSSKQLKDLPDIFKTAALQASAFAKSLDGVNTQLAKMVSQIEAIKKMGGVQVGVMQTVSQGRAAPATPATSATAAATGGGKPAAGAKPLSPAMQAARDKLEQARVQKVAAQANLASVNAAKLEARAAKIAADKLKTPAEKEAEAAKKRTEKRAQRRSERQVDNALEQDTLDENSKRRARRIKRETRTRLRVRTEETLKYERQREDLRQQFRAERKAVKDQEQAARDKARAEKKTEEDRDDRRKKILRGAGKAAIRVGGLAAGGLRGSEGIIEAIGAFGRDIPLVEGLMAGVSGILQNVYAAGSGGIELRDAANQIFALQERQTMFAKRPSRAAGSSGTGAPAGGKKGSPTTEEMQELSNQVFQQFLAPLPEKGMSPEESKRRSRETRLLRGTKSGIGAVRLSAQFGMKATDYLQLMAQYGRVVPGGVGKNSDEYTSGFPFALALSKVTGANVDTMSELSRGIQRRGFAGSMQKSLEGLPAGLQLNQAVLPLFAQAVADGMNESEAVGVLEELTRQVSRGAQLGVGTNVASGYMTLGAALAQKAGIDPARAYEVVSATGRKGQQLAYGARSPYDLMFLKYFGGLDLSRPVGSEEYYSALDRVSGMGTGSTEMLQGVMRMISSEMDKSGGMRGRGRVADILRATAGIDLTPNEVGKIFQAIQDQRLALPVSRPGATPNALEITRQVTSDASIRKAEMETRKDVAGLNLVEVFQSLDEIHVSMLENVKTVKDILQKFQSTASSIERMIRTGNPADVLKNVLFPNSPD